MPKLTKACNSSLTAAAWALVFLSGCQNWRQESVETKVQRALGTTSQKILADPVASTRIPLGTYPRALTESNRPASALETNPQTKNPAAAELRYSPADEKRSLSERLRRYAALEGLLIDESLTGTKPPDSALRKISLIGAWQTTQTQGRELLNAEEDYVLAAIQLLLERHLWGPRLFNDTTFGVSGVGDGGSFNHTLNIINQLRATQRLPYGGNVEAAWIINATDQLREQATQSYKQSSRIALSGQIPLLRGAGEVAREDLIQSERNLVYQARTFERFRREHLVSIASDYFRLVQARQAIVNQQRQLASFRALEKATAAKVAAGRLQAFDVGNAANRVQSALAQLATLVDQYIFRLERFKIRLGLPVDEPIAITGEIIDLPDPEADVAQAAALGLEYRLDLQNERDRLDDARRGVANAKNELLPQLDLKGDVALPTDPDDATGGLAISAGDLDYSAAATLSLPLDRQRERLSLRAAMVNLQKLVRSYEEARDNVIVEVRDALRSVDNNRTQLSIAEKQVEINRERLRGLQLQIDTIEPQDIIDAENDLLKAENDRDSATTSLRNSVLEYLLASDQLRVQRDGALQSLPGMNNP